MDWTLPALSLPPQAINHPATQGTLVVEGLQALVEQWIEGKTPTPGEALAALADQPDPVWAGVFHAGRLVGEAWGESEDGQGAATVRALEALDEVMADKPVDADTIVLCLTHGYKPVDLKTDAGQRTRNSNVFRGVKGWEIRYVDGEHKGAVERISPIAMVAENIQAKVAMERLRQPRGLNEVRFARQTEVRSFDAAQVQISPKRDGSRRAFGMFRGTQYVPVEMVTAESAMALQQILGDWLFNHVREDGRMTYMWVPHSGEEVSAGNNMIRQWMATIAMVRVAAFRKSEELTEKVASNIRFNLRNYYKTEGRLGYIQLGNMVKLGAIALAALALIEHPYRSKEFKRQERRMLAMMDHLWQPSGEFITLYKPHTRGRAANFYPGEALLTWSFLLEEKLDKKLLKQFMKSFAFYREWHLDPKNRNPAFIPWHTQAYYKVWKLTGDDKLKDFIFLMNDWLIEQMMCWEGQRYDDAKGRYYNSKVNYGSPHASSTGVYTEGMIDAWCLARDVGDEARQERYRRAIVRGTRSIMQLTYLSEDETYGCPQPEMILGGVRTTVYNGAIRCDNVQHYLMGLLRVLEHFEPADFIHDR